MYHILYDFFTKRHGVLLAYNEAKPEKDLPWPTLIGELSAGEIDALVAIPASPQLPALHYSTEPIVVSDQAIVYLKSNPVDTSDTEAWRAKRGLVAVLGQDKEANANYLLARHNGLVFRETQSTEQSIDYMMQGKGDYLISGFYRTKGILLHRGIVHDFEFESFHNPATNYYFAVKGGSQWVPLVDKFSDYLKKITESGKLEHLHNSYLKKWMNSNSLCNE
ncbi:transporter substrate-binding domain-containing protein [Oceanicoccus sp. KOV_DT_Chl]|uniref:transporter substrate-binding domain-containing protein n=1 Tax=Oceanicoccus sp. KOV_DT_Chl TaxID=1904639 RepID=UPI001F262EC9|nr:transporter substrate-binding domain-containing protein [Oceanicoccus sp. KOV_DT_Chl]